MAADIDISNVNYASKKGRIFMNKLRDRGLEYLSPKGSIVPAKVQPNSFCLCPQQCSKKVSPKEKWEQLFKQFYALGDQILQNQFLQSHIEIKPVASNGDNGKTQTPSKRRVSCKYYIPDLHLGGSIKDCTKVRADKVVQVCQRAFMSVYAISEKRLRMQREKCIARLEYEQLCNRFKCKDENAQRTENGKKRRSDDELDISPLHLSSEEKKIKSDNKPLDLSNPIGKAINSIEIDTEKLYEWAEVLGVPKKTVDKEMISKYEEFVKKSLQKQLKPKKKNETESKSPMKGLSEQVVGLQDQLAILPIQTLNNGDLTITPILGGDNQPVGNQDIMQVNLFFQNQLWKPEYLGLPINKHSLGTNILNCLYK